MEQRTNVATDQCSNGPLGPFTQRATNNSRRVGDGPPNPTELLNKIGVKQEEQDDRFAILTKLKPDIVTAK